MKNPFAKFYSAVWHIARPVILLFHPIEVTGKENLPEEPALFCANHSSAWDPVLLFCALKGEYPLRIMAKKQLFSIPVVGGFLRMLGVFPVDRGHSDIGAVKTAIRSLRDGFSLLMFPEGTRVEAPGREPAKPGISVVAIRSGVNFLPVFIGIPKKLFQKVPIIIGKPMAPAYTGRKGTAEEYQENADRVMARIYELGGVK